MKNQDIILIAVAAGAGYLFLKGLNDKTSQFVQDIKGTQQPLDAIKRARVLQARPMGAYDSAPRYVPNLQPLVVDKGSALRKAPGTILRPAAYPSQLEKGSVILMAPERTDGEWKNTSYKFREGEQGNLAQKMLDNLSFIPKKWIWG